MTTHDPILLEACVDSVTDAIAAERAGADRVELCADLLEGGTTPSAGALTAVRRHVAIPVVALIRPRAGDFVYSAIEHEVMLADLAAVRDAGLAGVAVGALTAAGEIDMKRMRALVDRARPLQVTCHRAFDRVHDLTTALEQLIELGVDRVLTAGGCATATEGKAALRDLVRRAGGRIAILAGGGVRAHNVAQVVRETGVREVHAGPRQLAPAGTTTPPPAWDLGSGSGPDQHWRADEAALVGLRTALPA